MTPRNEETKQEEGPDTGSRYEAGEIVPLEESDVEVADTTNRDGVEEVEVKDGVKDPSEQLVSADAPWIERYVDVLKAYWPLGFVAFGGPQAHVAILREHLVSDEHSASGVCT